MDLSIILHQVEFAKKLLNENPGKKLALASYTREEFAKLRPGEDYEYHQQQKNIFLEMLSKEGVNLTDIVFVEIDSAGFHEFIKQRELENNEGTRALYAQFIAEEEK